MFRNALLLPTLFTAAAACNPPIVEGSGKESVVVTFNTGTSEGLPYDEPPDDGYGSEQASVSDAYYGDGLAWQEVVDDVAAFFEAVDADVVVFQEIFDSAECAEVPSEARTGFVCETWEEGEPTVAQIVLGEGWQVACNLGKSDKCAAVRRSWGSFRGCDADLCLDGLDGAEVPGCGDGSRIGRGVVDRVEGEPLTLVNVHASSGLAPSDQACRVEQFRQVFVDLGLGDGQPAANGTRNLVMGDLNTDPGRAAEADPSAAAFASHVGEGTPFHFVTDVGPDATPTYGGVWNIDHVVSDALSGACWAAGVTDGRPAVTEIVYLDHHPVVCEVVEGGTRR